MSWSLFLVFLEVHQDKGLVFFVADFQNLSLLGSDEIRIFTFHHEFKTSGLFPIPMFHKYLVYINNCPMRCDTKQSIYYSASSVYMFRVSTAPIIRSTQNCNYSLPPTWVTLEGCKCLTPKHVEWTCRIINRLSCLHVCAVHQWRLKHFFVQQMHEYIIRRYN